MQEFQASHYIRGQLGVAGIRISWNRITQGHVIEAVEVQAHVACGRRRLSNARQGNVIPQGRAGGCLIQGSPPIFRGFPHSLQLGSKLGDARSALSASEDHAAAFYEFL
jgi:hypothetical protein